MVSGSLLWSSAELWSFTAHRGQSAPFGSCRWLQRAQYYSISFRFTVWCCSVSTERFLPLPLHSPTQKAATKEHSGLKICQIKCKVEVQHSVLIWSDRQVSQHVVIMKFPPEALFGSESIAASALWLMFAVWTRAMSLLPEQTSEWLLDDSHWPWHWCCFLQNSWF